ncbi:CerR family C-terminal domain-containing protein [Jannaschia formosa]|uniref:CerR family C-terminal domain-containing protein n=1 Tax=Jannaschia formosa TaxID=2259592 RepID=UPI0014302876|nr:CerR family C-terminal domain-containing protein [Jannaschia formosa]
MPKNDEGGAKASNRRGEETRARMVAVALELFGQRGYEGVGARELTEAAGVPLGALPYHFGTKEALYRAALEQVRDRLAQALAPAAAEAAEALKGPPEAADQALRVFQGALFDALATTPEAEAWAKLLLREHLDPSPAFDLVYEDAARGAVELMAALLAHASGRIANDPDVLLEAFARMGEVLTFRILQAAVVRRLGWTALGPDEAAQVRLAVFKLKAS